MKTLILFCSYLIFTSVAQAQFETIDDLDTQKLTLEKNLKDQAEVTKRYQAQYDDYIKQIEDNKKELAELESYEQEFGQNRIVAIDEINESIKKIPFFQKLGEKANFYKCLRSSLTDNNYLNVETCSKMYTPKLSDEENASIEQLKTKVGRTLSVVKIRKESLPRLITQAESMLPTFLSNKKFSQSREDIIVGTIKTVEIKKKELGILPKHPEFLKCDENTPEINLENKEPFAGADFQGPFFGVPIDNQDGLGTCYANAAKNLLVGISGGKNVASFLDIALAYKNENGGVVGGLDGGTSCTALNAIAKAGYCPQHFSAIETGERNIAGEGLFNLDPYNYLATNVNLLRNFLDDLGTMQKSTSPVSAAVMGKAQKMIEHLKAHPEIKIPLPIARFEIPEKWKLKEAFALKKIPGMKESDFIKEYDEAYKAFYPLYVKSLIEGKTIDQIFALWTEKMNPFITKYGLESNLPEFKRVWKTNVTEDFKDPAVKKQLRVSLDFLKDMMDKKEATDDEFLEICATQASDSLNFLSALNPLVEKLRDNKLNEEKLFDKDGKFHSAYELMQLTVAPSCLNKDNRVMPEPFTCSDGYDVITSIKSSAKPQNEKVQALRNKVVLSLIQGMPLGNTFPMSGGWHINTIAGMRFNKTAGRCEYLIRESQTGSSGWHDEQKIFEKIESLTEVRKQK
jgi:hypothetical protein